MKKQNGIYYKHRHGCFLIQYHLVLVTKYRKPVLTGGVKETVYDTIRRTLKEWDWNLVELNGQEDHVHILFEADPSFPLLKAINVLKSRTSRFSWRDYPEDLAKFYYGKKHLLWTDSYFVTTVGYNSKEAVCSYIRHQ